MRTMILSLLALAFSATVNAQTAWTWTELANMPVRIANNAVTHGTVNGFPYVYSFAGIDSTRDHDGINLGAYRLNMATGLWDVLPDVPDTLGKIAAAASTVKNKIYLIGGYHVFANGNEISSDLVHIFDPTTNSWEPNGASIPTPIDDQVQAVWRDSLIFVVTGWSNTGNVTDVQIYDPALDQWQVGTSLPNSSAFTAFGASGAIVGDTIFYHGGAAGFNFNGRKNLRKGVIDPNDPTQITWTDDGDAPGVAGYRHAPAVYNDRLFWIGGSGVTYNYNGIAYNGSGAVAPLDRILTYHANTGGWIEGLGAPQEIMDLRGAAQVGPISWVICGGMEAGPSVTNRAFLVEYDPIIGSVDESGVPFESFNVAPNPNQGYLVLEGLPAGELRITDLQGRIVHLESVGVNQRVDLRHLENAIYYVELVTSDRIFRSELVKQNP